VERDEEQVVTLAEAKAMLHVSGTDHDARIDALIDAATSRAQNYQVRKYITQTCVSYFDAWPLVIRPRWSPLVQVTSIQYIDGGGVLQTLAADRYDVDTDREPGRVVPAYNCSWPSIRGDMNGIIVTYTAGYGSDADDVPPEFRHAILLMVYDWFFNPDREGDLPRSAQALLGFERMGGV
jgi:uncharacterized phiE125 gp8 family phage protein